MSDANKILLETGTNEMELLAVIIDDQYFGMNVAKVQSIQQYDEKLITSIPATVPAISGMFLYRGNTIPLIDLAAILDKKSPPPSEDSKEIIVITEFNNSTNSFKVQGVNQIYRLSWEKLAPLNEMVGNTSYITGSVFIDDHEILVLDLEHILATLFPQLTLEDVNEELLQQQQTIKRDQLKIVFAEDSSIIRKGVVKALTNSGYTNINEFENGKLAHDFIFNNKEEYSQDSKHTVLISDIEMPVMDGLSLCKTVKTDNELKDIHVIMFSSLINKPMIVKCKSIGADNYVTKPEINKLIGLLDDFCDSK